MIGTGKCFERTVGIPQPENISFIRYLPDKIADTFLTDIPVQMKKR